MVFRCIMVSLRSRSQLGSGRKAIGGSIEGGDAGAVEEMPRFSQALYPGNVEVPSSGRRLLRQHQGRGSWDRLPMRLSALCGGILRPRLQVRPLIGKTLAEMIRRRSEINLHRFRCRALS